MIAPLGALAVGGGAGFLAGYALKKIIKLVAIVVGAILLAVLYLSSRGWLFVQWDKINDSVMSLTNSSTSVSGAQDIVHNITNSLGLPASGGIAGFMRG